MLQRKSRTRPSVQLGVEVLEGRELMSASSLPAPRVSFTQKPKIPIQARTPSSPTHKTAINSRRLVLSPRKGLVSPTSGFWVRRIPTRKLLPVRMVVSSSRSTRAAIPLPRFRFSPMDRWRLSKARRSVPEAPSQ